MKHSLFEKKAGIFNFYWIAPVVFALGLSGCNNFSGNTTEVPIQSEALVGSNDSGNDDSFSNTDAQDFDLCGDTLPSDPSSYPLEVYPLYIEYASYDWSQSTETIPELIDIRESFCPNANMGYIRGGEAISEDDPILDVAILGYFINPSQAQKALASLEDGLVKLKSENKGTNLVSAHLGGPIRLKELPDSSENIGRRARLSEQQIQDLLSIDVHGDIGITVDILVPTYIPEGYEVHSITAFRQGEDEWGFAPSYEIVYRSPGDSCFRVDGFTSTGGAGAEDVQYAEAFSPILGKVTLMYIDFVQERNGPFLNLKYFSYPTRFGGSQLYDFGSADCTDTLSLNEAVKVVESLQYLRHPLHRNRSNSSN
jgi:hypothetical protein